MRIWTGPALSQAVLTTRLGNICQPDASTVEPHKNSGESRTWESPSATQNPPHTSISPQLFSRPTTQPLNKLSPVASIWNSMIQQTYRNLVPSPTEDNLDTKARQEVRKQLFKVNRPNISLLFPVNCSLLLYYLVEPSPGPTSFVSLPYHTLPRTPACLGNPPHRRFFPKPILLSREIQIPC